jgi:hypothetical protein
VESSRIVIDNKGFKERASTREESISGESKYKAHRTIRERAADIKDSVWKRKEAGVVSSVIELGST